MVCAVTAPVVLGIDPGKTGALAWVRGEDLLLVDDMPDLTGAALGARLADLLIGTDVHVAVVESQVGRPGQSSSAGFKFGTNYGVILGTLGALGIRVTHVTPAAWKRALRLSKDKTASRQRAVELWPDRADLFARVKDDGRAEAALIAHHHITQGTPHGPRR